MNLLVRAVEELSMFFSRVIFAVVCNPFVGNALACFWTSAPDAQQMKYQQKTLAEFIFPVVAINACFGAIVLCVWLFEKNWTKIKSALTGHCGAVPVVAEPISAEPISTETVTLSEPYVRRSKRVRRARM